MRIIITEEKNAYEFLKMLAWMELCCGVGHTADFNVHVDGDGQASIRFEFINEHIEEDYNKIKKQLLKKYIDKHKDIKEITFK